MTSRQAQAAQQILQHADEAGLSPQDWAEAFNKFKHKIANHSMFDPNTVTPSQKLLQDWYLEDCTVQDKLILAARWGATQAVGALRHQWPEPITDRPPTEADADCHGHVQYLYAGKWNSADWDNVADDYGDWLHTPSWRLKPEPTPKEQALALLDSKNADVVAFNAEQIQLLRQVVEAAQDGAAGLGLVQNPQAQQVTAVSASHHVIVEEIALSMLPIPAGSFLMGSPDTEAGRFGDEGPQHEVTLGAFWMAQTPITQAQWRTVAGWQRLERDLDPDPSHFKGANRPVERVSWFDAQEFCRRLSQRTGQLYGLPSEAQWEYACRAGSTTPFHFGATLTSDQANCNGSETCDVATFPSNDWGLHDMHGNVWEWCQDHWHGSYDGAPMDGSAWGDGGLGKPPGCCAAGRGAATPRTAARPTATAYARATASTSSVSASVAFDDVPRLLRGGSWISPPSDCRSAFRNLNLPVNRSIPFGFRVCCLPQD